MPPRAAALLVDPPLDPSADEARSRLRRELLDPAYHQQNPLQELVSWLDRQVGRGLDAASGAPPVQAFAAMLVLVGLVLALGLLLSRARRSSRTRERTRPVLTDEQVSATVLRARAEAALREGRTQDAVVEGFRALTRRQVERGRLGESPGATAHEVATVLVGEYPDRGDRVSSNALLFDAVRYGDRPADAAQARAVLDLDDELAVHR